MSWEDLKEKLSLGIIICIALYLLAGVVVVGFFFPARDQVAKLQSELDQAKVQETMLNTTIAQLPNLEAQKGQLTGSIQVVAEQIPTQYDLPQVLEFLRATALRFDVDVEKLSHEPVSRDGNSQGPWVTVTMLLLGDEGLLSYIYEVQRLLPSFHVEGLTIARAGRTQFGAELEGKLYLRDLGQDLFYAWQVPAPDDELGPWVPAFSRDVVGWPAAVIQAMANGSVQLVGVVEREGQRIALVAADGQRQWLSQGDWLGDAQVVQVEPKAVTLALGTTKLKLQMGE
ncbi:MAG TPA: hypothetical protein GX008_08960 [Firmicutes bacterium]|jgi:hypothetical protein|nr:hypothetical protein [Bacillota bacterium]